MTEPGYVRLFPEIYSISDFIRQNHPTHLHPDSTAYHQYWEEVERRSIEGLWGKDMDSTGTKGGYRYMTPELHHFINCNKILATDGKTRRKPQLRFPRLMDTTWIMAYGWFACSGFSGFSDDHEHSCFRPLEKLEQGKELDEEELLLLEMAGPRVFKPDGTYKKYVNVIDYLYKTHSRPMGLPEYDNTALDFLLFCTRGFGKSYFMMACIDHAWRYHGTRVWTPDWISHIEPRTIFVGSSVESKLTALLTKWELNDTWIKSGLGSYSDRLETIPGALYQESQGRLEPNAKKPLTHLIDYKEIKSNSSTWNEVGSRTQIIAHVYTASRLTQAVSQRAEEMFHDEIGLTPYLEIIWGANENVKTRDFRNGREFMAGTGGEIAKAIGCKKLMTNPRGYKILPYPDHFEKSGHDIGCFVPAYMAKTVYKDDLGNTKYEMAFRAEMQTRSKLLEDGGITAYTEHVQNNPITWTEIFLETGNIYMPIELARQTLSQLNFNKQHLIYGKAGHFEYTDDRQKEVVWRIDPSRKYNPIRTNDLHTLNGQLRGDIVIYEHPDEYIPSPVYDNSLYKITYDPLKDDGPGASLGAIIVWKGIPDLSKPGGWSETIVATYYGRRDNVDEIHEIAYQLALYYNAKVLFEVNVGSVATWFRMKGVYHMLQPCPMAAMKDLLKNPTSKYKVGVHMSTELIINAEPLVRKLLSRELYIDEKGNVVRLIHNFKCTFMLEQIIAYNRDGNFDAIRALMMLAVWLEQDKRAPVNNNPDQQKESFMEIMKKRREENAKEQYAAYDRLLG